MIVSITIKNLDQVRAALLKSPQVVSKHINKAINRSIIGLRDTTIQNAHFKHGHGGTGILGALDMQFGQLRGSLHPNKNYAVPLHEGHRQQVGRYVKAIGKRLVSPYVQGNPFLRRAVDMSEGKINQFFKEGLSDALSEIARGV